MGTDGNEELENKRKVAGWISFGLGFPNLLIGASLTMGGIIVSVMMGIIAVSAFLEGPGDGPLAVLSLMILLIILMVLIIIGLIFTFISFLFAMAMAGQSIGGYHAIKGKHYVRSISFIFIGSVASLVVSVFLIMNFISSDFRSMARFGILAFGIFEFISSIGSLICGIILLKTRTTFR